MQDQVCSVMVGVRGEHLVTGPSAADVESMIERLTSGGIRVVRGTPDYDVERGRWRCVFRLVPAMLAGGGEYESERINP